jgi:hypothetical protein
MHFKPSLLQSWRECRLVDWAIHDRDIPAAQRAGLAATADGVGDLARFAFSTRSKIVGGDTQRASWLEGKVLVTGP